MDPVAKVLLKCVISFSSSFRWYAFPSFCTCIVGGGGAGRGGGGGYRGEGRFGGGGRGGEGERGRGGRTCHHSGSLRCETSI